MAQMSESHFELLRRSLTLYANKEVFISDRQNIELGIAQGDKKTFDTHNLRYPKIVGI